MSEKKYRCYRNSGFDYDFVCRFLKNRGLWTDDLEELDTHVSIELHPFKDVDYACAPWPYYPRLKELCLMADEYRAISAREEMARRETHLAEA